MSQLTQRLDAIQLQLDQVIARLTVIESNLTVASTPQSSQKPTHSPNIERSDQSVVTKPNTVTRASAEQDSDLIDPPQTSLDSLREQYNALMRAKPESATAVIALLSNHNAISLSDLSPEHYDAVHSHLSSLLSAT